MSKSILVIEDYPETLELLLKIFEGEGYNVEAVSTGEKALERLATKRYDLVVLDIMLPRLDGFEVCRRIRADQKTSSLPVFAVTAFDVPDIISRCRQVGASEVVLKPFEPEDLLRLVNKYLSS